MKFIDLFAGIGGFRLGLEKLGWECVYSAEIDDHACEMYELNYGVNPKNDISKMTESDIKNIPEFDVLCAGFPCQSFSISGKKQGFYDKVRGTLFFDILRILNIKRPAAFILENVKHLIHHDKGNTLNIMIDSLSQLGYTVNFKVLNAKDFGVPQNRERIIIVGILDNKIFDFNQLKLSSVHSMELFLDKQGKFEVLDSNEYTLIDSKYIKRQNSDLIFVGYRNKNIRTKGVREGTEHLSRTHKMPNRIYSSKGVHPTLSSQESSGRYFILIDGIVRKITINEAYRFMGFPDSFKKIGSKAKLYNRIGNSVCVNMITEIGRVLEMTMNSKNISNDINPDIFLEEIYNKSEENGKQVYDNLSKDEKKYVETIVKYEHSSKGVYTVLFTSLVYKILHPKQDIRYHQASLENGYSGRSFDTKYITPFLKRKRFDGAMKESGWLTRSLEQNLPYDLEYPGKIQNKNLKRTFLLILDKVQKNEINPEDILISIIYRSLEEKRKNQIDIINPVNSESKLTISDIMVLLEKHFSYINYKNGSKGNSILPVIAMYSIYQCLMNELVRYKDKKLKPRESHYSSDKNSGATGDIVIVDKNNENEIYEVVEVKYGIKIDELIIEDAYNKFKQLGTMQRYYILSTVIPSDDEKRKYDELTKRIFEESGTQLICNGLMKTLNYYLRLISNTDDFIDAYTKNLQKDTELNAEHKLSWNHLVKEYMENKF